MNIDNFLRTQYGVETSEAIDIISKNTGYGNITSNYQQVFRGLNHRGMGNPVSKTLENVGVTLISKPYCNLTYDNIKMVRLLTPLMHEDPKSLQSFIRCSLDPRSHKGINVPEKIDSIFVNEYDPFMPLLTNCVLSTSGWPDIVANTYTSPEGMFKETRTYIDGNHNILGNWPLTITFRNIDGDPFTHLLYNWIIYACSLRLEGDDFVAYPDSIINTRVDYETGIWHLVFNPTKQYVLHIAKTIAAPVSCPIGATFNQQNEQHYITSKDQVSVQFTCNGAEYDDPILIYEFNRLQGIYDSRMIITKVTNTDIEIQGDLIRLSPSDLIKANGAGRMLIHPHTGKVFYYVDDFEYNLINRQLVRRA